MDQRRILQAEQPGDQADDLKRQIGQKQKEPGSKPLRPVRAELVGLPEARDHRDHDQQRHNKSCDARNPVYQFPSLVHNSFPDQNQLLFVTVFFILAVLFVDPLQIYIVLFFYAQTLL